jgi:transketolase
MRTTFINTLVELAKDDPSIFLITPDLGYAVLEKFAKAFPNRFLNIGIAEQNAVGIASGLALSGYKVYMYSIVPFVTMRCFEQVRLDIAYMNTDVKLVGVGEGYSYGPAGATHHAIEDIAIMRVLPNMKVCCPGDPYEVRKIVEQSTEIQGPMYIRLGKNNEPTVHNTTDNIKIGKASVLRSGNDFALITTGNMLELGASWIKEWVAQGYNPEFISMHTVKPLDKDIITSLIARNMNIIALEEHSVLGGLGSAISEVIAGFNTEVKLIECGIPDIYSHYVGSEKAIAAHYGLFRIPGVKELGL